jgi:hypothetical protein
MDVLIRFIGIVLFACLGNNPTDACIGPVTLNAYLPDGRGTATAEVESCGFAIPRHHAYVRVQQKHSASAGWTPIECKPAIETCKLYPLDKDTLTVSGLGGSGVTKIAHGRDDLRLRNHYPNLRLLPHNDATARSVAWMEITSGELNLINMKHGMHVGHLSQKVPKGDLTITATNAAGSRTIVIENANKIVFDIVNLPDATARDHPIEGTVPMPAEPHTHFFLHYLLAANPPKCDCLYPTDDAPPTPGPHRNDLMPAGHVATLGLGGYVACSNTTYP